MKTEEIIEIAEKVPGHMSQSHLRTLIGARKKTDGICVEIGCLLGRSSVALGLSGGPVISIDKFKVFTEAPLADVDLMHDFYQKWYDNVSRYSDIKKHTGLQGSSSDPIIIQKIQDVKDEIGMLFIDGSHEYDFVKKDIENYLPILKPGTTVVFHDYHPQWGVYEAVNEAMRAKKIKQIGGSYTLVTEKI